LQRGLDDHTRGLAVEWRDPVLQQGQLGGDVGRDQVAAGREDLPELDEDRPEFLQRQTQTRAAGLRGDLAGGARHERARELEPALGRGAVEQVVEAVAQQHAADPPCAEEGLHAVSPTRVRRRAMRAAARSTSSRSPSTSSWKALSSSRGTTSRDSSVTNSAALPANSFAATRAWRRPAARALATCTPITSPNTRVKGCCQSGSKRSASRCRRRARSASPSIRS